MKAGTASYVVGIDLGTTNCALAYAGLAPGREAAIEDFRIPQLQRPGQVGEQLLLPSFLYSAGEHELGAGAAQLPWGESPRFLVGEVARWQGSRVPGRLVASAKSWLCHPDVDREAAILPWGAPAEVAKLSPAEASARLLGHLVQAWNHRKAQAPLAEQEVVITVPASFDEVARALTVNAARRAGLEHFTLLEEPQAAFYDFTSRRRDDLAAALRDIRLVLVVDVGGGTSDFTLIRAAVGDEGPVLKRIAVGEHLMLGGDNMDAALARRVEQRLTAGGKRLSSGQWTQLVQAARAAKESLLSVEGVESFAVSVAGEGSRLLGSTLSATVERAEVEELVLDGFFPKCGPEERPRRAARVALQELGLPYAQDAAISRHLAAFLQEHAAAGWAALGEKPTSEGQLPRPDAILLNGGVFNSTVITARLIDALSAWWPDFAPIPQLKHESLDLAVARGAAYYGLVRRGLGRRIGGGAAHAFYVGIAEGKGDDAVTRAVCVVPRGQEEGQVVDLKERPFSLTLGQPVQFPLYSTTADRVDRPGAVVEIDDSYRALPPIHSLLRGQAGKGGVVPVHLRANLTELGTLELWCVSDAADERWRLEFDLRGAARQAGSTVVESMPERFGEVKEIVERIYGAAPRSVDPKDVRRLRGALEAAIGPRDEWSLPLLREIWGTLFAGANKRRRTVEHERTFYQLIGYSLRPGFGYPLDEWRGEQTFRLFKEGVNARAETSVWREYWILWRRIAGGLTELQQGELWDFIKPHLARQVPPKAKNASKPKGPQPQGIDEMVRTAAALEEISPGEKELFGRWIVERLKDPKLRNGPWAWALGRLGARVPIHGSVHRTVDPERAAEWVQLLLELGLSKIEGAPFAVAQLARLTGDRARDLEAPLRLRVVEALRHQEAPERWQQMVTEVTQLEAADEARALGDTLPVGLRL
jgi:molecular chaperone DnaK (HSP70)